MKRINDTYTALSDTKVQIKADAKILTDDPVICSYLEPLCKGESGIKKIEFLPFDKNAEKIAVERFPNAEKLRGDGYLIVIDDMAITVWANTKIAEIYAAVCISSHFDTGIAEGAICNIPLVNFRAMKIFIPAREQIPFFEQFIDMCLYYGFNTVVIEVGGAMEYKRHPEINEGWEEYTEIFREWHGKSVAAQKCMMHLKDSIHWENGGGSYLLQDEVRALVDYAKARGIEVIPEVPSLSHSDYLLTRHPELAENVADPIPDTYCPNHPDVYPLVFDVIDEVLEVFRPKCVHIAHDEWYSAGICPRCRRQNPAEMFEADIRKIHGYLTERKVEVMMWADMLVQCIDKNGNLRGSGMTVAKIPTSQTVTIRDRVFNMYNELWGLAGAQMAELGGTAVFHAPLAHPAIEKLPRDIIMMNWMHHYDEDLDLEYLNRGYRSVYGNFSPRGFTNWSYCISRGVEGACISSWSMFDLAHMQRMGTLFSMAYASMMMWSRDFDESDIHANTLAVGHDLYLYQRSNSHSPCSVEIVHAFAEKMPHEPFWDGNTINFESDRLGCYKIDYTDGTSERRDIFYGLNIGVMQDENYNAESDPNGVSSQILEPIYTCDFEVANEKIYYRTAFDSEKEIACITPEICEEYKSKVEILKIEIKNR